MKATLRLVLLITFVCFVFPSQTRATCQEGCDTRGQNTYLGDDALANNFLGGWNVAVGSQALVSNATGNWNTAIGYQSLYNNTGGFQNTATGFMALFFNSTGGSNTATGAAALQNNTTGVSNTATGASALAFNQTGSHNTATGVNALSNNHLGDNNTANGYLALSTNNAGKSNTATGVSALQQNRSGSGNTANGAHALYRAKGKNNIALGAEAGVNLTTGDNNIAIGNPGLEGESNNIRIGTEGLQTATYIAGINAATIASGVGVVIDTDGHLGTITSSARYKDNIQPMARSSEAILSLKPVTFHYKKELDRAAIPQFGLVAEDVAQVDPNLVARDQAGKPYTVRYEAVNAMLLNEFLKEHQKVEQQAGQLNDQKHEIAELKAALAEQGAQLQDVTARLKANGL